MKAYAKPYSCLLQQQEVLFVAHKKSQGLFVAQKDYIFPKN